MKGLQAYLRTLTTGQIIYAVIRIILGIMLITYGLPKLLGGTETLIKVGSNMSLVSVGGSALFWGVMAMLAQLGGGILLIIGAFARVAGFMVSFAFVIILIVMGTMVGSGKMTAIPLGKFAEVLFYLYGSMIYMLIGPGKASLDEYAKICMINNAMNTIK